MAIELAQVTQRRRIGWILQVRAAVIFLRQNITLRILSSQPADHRLLDERALASFVNRRVKDLTYLASAELLQLFGGVLRFLREQTFLGGDRLEELNGCVLVTCLCLVLSLFQLRFERRVALLDFRADELFYLFGFQEVICALRLVDDGAIGFGEDGYRRLRIAEHALHIG